jgi:hypothetical protein
MAYNPGIGNAPHHKGVDMSDEGLNKMKAMFKEHGEKFAEAAGQKLGEAAFEMKKALDKASPVAKTMFDDMAEAAKSARDSFQKAMDEAEAKARAEQASKPEDSGQAKP